MEKVKRKMLYLDIFSVPILVLGNEYHLGRFKGQNVCLFLVHVE